MALDHPARIIVSQDGTVFLDIEAGSTPSSVFGFVGMVIDSGGVARSVLSDTGGRQVVVGAGTAGAPAGGVVTIQGVSGGVVIPVSDGGGSLTVDTPQLPAALVVGRLDTNMGAWLGATTPTVGQKAMAASLPVVIATDQSVIPVSQHGPPWKVEGTDADGAPPTENPVLVAGQDGTNVQTLKTETDGTLRTKDAFIDDRNKIVGVNFAKEGVAATTYYVFVDLNGAQYKHTAGTAAVVTAAGGKAIKSNAAARWVVNLMAVLRIDGTDADLGILPLASVTLRDTSVFVGDVYVVLFPVVSNLAVSGGDFTKIANGYKELNVAAVNTGVTFEDVFGNNVTPAVGDVLLRTTLISGSGTLDFGYGMQYWVE